MAGSPARSHRLRLPARPPILPRHRGLAPRRRTGLVRRRPIGRGVGRGSTLGLSVLSRWRWFRWVIGRPWRATVLVDPAGLAAWPSELTEPTTSVPDSPLVGAITAHRRIARGARTRAVPLRPALGIARSRPTPPGAVAEPPPARFASGPLPPSESDSPVARRPGRPAPEALVSTARPPALPVPTPSRLAPRPRVPRRAIPSGSRRALGVRSAPPPHTAAAGAPPDLAATDRPTVRDASAPIHPVTTHADPVAAWRASTEQRPLESPRELPVSWRPLARRVAGAAGVRYTTGPATRAALAAAGALGATTRRVIHLPREPVAADLPVVAHELAHVRSAPARPRFLLADRHAHADAEERTAIATARAATTGPGVAGLPVGGAAVVVARTPSGDAVAAGAVPGGGSHPPTSAAPLARDAEPARATSAPGSPTTGSTTREAAEPAAPAVDYERLVGYLESWLVREFERRGGRFGGLF